MTAEARQILESIPLFAEVLGPAELKTLAAGAHPAFFRAGTLLMSQGDLGGSMFAITKGTVSVNFTDGQGRERKVAELGPGEVVGEMSLFTGDRRTATVTASTNVDALQISKASLEKIFVKSPELCYRFGAILADRQAQLSAAAGPRHGNAKEEFARQARRFFTQLFGRPQSGS